MKPTRLFLLASPFFLLALNACSRPDPGIAQAPKAQIDQAKRAEALVQQAADERKSQIEAQTRETGATGEPSSP